MNKEELFLQIQKKFPKIDQATFPEKYIYDDVLQLRVSKDMITEVCRYFKEDTVLSLDYLEFLTAVDWIQENRFEIIYYLISLEQHHHVILRVNLSREGEPEIPSVVGIYAAADWQERETYDLYGIRFSNHPNLKRILLWEGYAGWPLRKDYIHVTDQYDSGAEIGTPKPSSGGTP